MDCCRNVQDDSERALNGVDVSVDEDEEEKEVEEEEEGVSAYRMPAA